MKLKACAMASLPIVLLLLPIGVAQAQPENIGRIQEPLVTPRAPLDQQTQEEFGLLTLSTPEGTCSASMLNDYWAITAAHCVFSRQGACPQFMPQQIRLQANWPGNSNSAQALRVITYGTPAPCPFGSPQPFDIAILQTGRHDFGRPDFRSTKLEATRLTPNLTVTAYGRGINALAFQAGPNAVPSQSDGLYRSAEFSIDSTTPNSAMPTATYSFAGNRGATVAGGDSGGPSFIEDWDDPLSTRRKLEWRLIGVHSFCQTTCLPGQTCPAANPWPWVGFIQQCTDAAILPVRNDILSEIEAVPVDDTVIGTFPTATPASVLSQKRALYAISLDEPLAGPPGAAIDVQLTFERCHDRRVIAGCPVNPEFEQWAYDPTTHRLHHAASGKCVNISGARLDPGSPIILFPCVGGANEKWTLIERAGWSSIWSIKSDLTGMCLHAVPGRPRGEATPSV